MTLTRAELQMDDAFEAGACGVFGCPFSQTLKP